MKAESVAGVLFPKNAQFNQQCSVSCAQGTNCLELLAKSYSSHDQSKASLHPVNADYLHSGMQSNCS